MAILGLSVAIVLAVAVMPYSLAEPQETAEDAPEFGTVTVPINDETSLEKTTMAMNIPEDNTLPWAYVDGVIENHAEGYPVIIQFFNEESGDDPLHVAQVEVNEDGSYEYKFRVRDLDLETGIATNIFEGDYVVKVFKVINSQDDDSESV
jgi:hypothetical protein